MIARESRRRAEMLIITYAWGLLKWHYGIGANGVVYRYYQWDKDPIDWEFFDIVPRVGW